MIRRKGHLSGGAGVTASMTTNSQGSSYLRGILPKERRASYGPQPTPQAVYERYLQWLADGVFDGALDMFTPETKNYLAGWPMTKAYFHQFLIAEYGKRYRVTIQKDRALLYFVDTPFLQPHFLLKTKTAGRWIW